MFDEPVNPRWAVILAMALLLGAFLQRILTRAFLSGGTAPAATPNS